MDQDVQELLVKTAVLEEENERLSDRLKDVLGIIVPKKVRKKTDPLDPRTILKHQMITLFKVEELEALCFDLDIEWENLKRENKILTVQEIIEYVENRSMTYKLIKQLQIERPSIMWPSL